MTTVAIKTGTAADKGRPSYDQDRSLTKTAADHTLIGVFDGHSTLGAEFATWAVEHFAAAHPTETLGEVFASADNALRARLRTHLGSTGVSHMEVNGAFYHRGYYGARGTPVRGGTTASALRINHESGAMEFAHVGDSDVRVFDQDGADADGVSLMEDHSPTNLSEWNRIHASHPTTRFIFDDRGLYPRRPVFVPSAAAGGWTLNPVGGYTYADIHGSWGAYVQTPDGSASLAMTRALGDYDLKACGVSDVPHITVMDGPAPGTTRAIVVASDGLWDATEFAAVQAIVRRPDLLGACNAEAAAAEVLALGIQSSKAKFGGSACHDNITVSVVYVTAPEPVPEPAPAALLLFPPLPQAQEEDEEAPALPPTAADLGEPLGPPASSGVGLQPPIMNPEITDPMVAACELHGWRVRGGLGYSPSCGRGYNEYAPPCNGCSIGEAEVATCYGLYPDATAALAAAVASAVLPNEE
jgi:serine/threonine protein phosphatase PrpC